MRSHLIPVILVLLSAVGARAIKLLSCECGWTNTQKKNWLIVGGNETSPNKYPWMVSVQLNRIHHCGGSIITPWHVLTAAHCLWEVERRRKTHPSIDVKLVFGAHNLRTVGSRSVQIPMAYGIMHSGFSGPHPEIHYDIALMVTARRIPFSEYIGPVCMPISPLDLNGQFVRTIGWGLTKYDGSPSDVLLEVELRVISKELCYQVSKVLGWSNLQQKVCTYGRSSQICRGDSGGPLVWLDPYINRYTLVALVSYGLIVCPVRFPSVHTDVTTYIDWIDQHIQATKPGVEVCRML